MVFDRTSLELMIRKYEKGYKKLSKKVQSENIVLLNDMSESGTTSLTKILDLIAGISSRILITQDRICLKRKVKGMCGKSP